jgi:hypothetical protein
MPSEMQIGLVTLATLALGALFTYLVKLINAKVKNETLRNVLARVTLAVGAAVKATAQTYSDALKAASADGTLTPDEQRDAAAKALEKAKSYISLTEVAKAFGLSGAAAAESFLADQVESAVKDMKSGK